jgi:8-oxo-dGTP diphosphatase
MKVIVLTLALIVFPPLCLVGLIYHFISGGGSHYFLKTSSALSQLTNAFCAKLLNKIMLKGHGNYVPFGNPDETVSGVLGKNNQLKALSWLGSFVRKVLNKADPNHTENAIEFDE